LPQEAITQAVLADGSTVTLESYQCDVLWFGEKVTAQVIANEGRLPLLGTELLDQLCLVVDFRAKTIDLQ
jgi:predicted aspartyl protease